MNRIDTEPVHERVSAFEAGKALGLHPDRHGRCACPIHNGHDRNCCLDKGGKGYYCHVCHAGGDVIKLVRAVQNCSFTEAVRWLDSTFHLGLEMDRPLDRNENMAAEIARKRKAAMREQEKAIDAMLYDLWVMSNQILACLEEDAKRYRPTRPYAPWDGRFTAALKLLPEAKETVAFLADQVIGVK